MNLRLSFGVLLFAANALIAAAAHAGIAQDVAAYDRMLADVRQGQTTIAMGDMIVSVETVRLWRERLGSADSLDSPVQWRILADQIPGTASPIPLLDPGAAALSRRLYRANVQP